ncbi:MAG: hypothetical protein NZ765_09695 [Anaerolineae bacterium]|nr:hypothetical protein [Anaerolineae bacterium]MDW8071817.1 hypothetical protein [Anaerolineae bacterium]
MAKVWPALVVALGSVLVLVLGSVSGLDAAPLRQSSGVEEAEVLAAAGVEGHLAPGAQTWYRYYPAGASLNRTDAVTLIFKPAVQLGVEAMRAGFQIFSLRQVTSGRDVDTLAPIGVGARVSRDGDPDTAEYLWQGVLPGADPYFVRVYNRTSLGIDFWLFPDDVVHLVRPETPPATEETPEAAMTALVDIEADFPWEGVAIGHLEVGQKAWYRWGAPGEIGKRREYAFTLFFMPGNTVFADRVKFELLTEAQRQARQSGNTLANTGAGAIVSRDGDPATGERLWHGHLVAGEAFLLHIANDSDAPIDYWLLQGDVERLEPEKYATPTPTPVPTS